MVMSILQSPTEWGPVGAVAKVEQLPPANSRSSEASRSDDGSSAAHPSKSGTPKTSTGVIIGGISLTDDGATKKKRGPKFLVKQFGMITKPANASPRRNFKLLGQDYVVPIPGSRAVASTNDSVSVDADLKVDNRDGNANAEPSNNSVITRTEPVLEQQGNVTEEPPMEFVGVSTDFKIDKPGVVKEQHRNVARPPIEFVTVPVDFKQEKRGVVDRPPIEFVTMPVDFKKGNRRVVREDRPVDFVPRCSPRVGPHVRLDSMLRNHSSEESSPSVSGRLSYSQVDSPRSQRSVLSIPETIMSSIEHEVYSEDNLKPHSRTSLSSLAEWSSHSLERRGELSIAGLSIGEGRNIAGISRRTDVTSAQSPNRSDTQALDYGPGNLISDVLVVSIIRQWISCDLKKFVLQSTRCMNYFQMTRILVWKCITKQLRQAQGRMHHGGRLVVYQRNGRQKLKTRMACHTTSVGLNIGMLRVCPATPIPDPGILLQLLMGIEAMEDTIIANEMIPA